MRILPGLSKRKTVLLDHSIVLFYIFKLYFFINMELENTRKFGKGSQHERCLIFFKQITVDGSNKTHQCVIPNCGKLIAGQKPSSPAYYAIKKLKFIQNCVELVSINARPFRCLMDSGFKKIVQEQLKELEEGNCSVNLNSNKFPEIKSYIESVSTKITKQIQAEVKNKLVSVMVDITTKSNKSLLGISLQYILNGAILVRSVGMIEMKESHTAAYILKLIKACLNTYEISSQQIVSITSDNASNMTSMMNSWNNIEPEGLLYFIY